MRGIVALGLIAAVAALVLADASGGPATTRAAFPGANGKIAFVSDRDGNREIYVMNADGTDETRLTINLSDEGSPAWSPDGSKIAFVSNRDGNREIYVMNADGAQPQRLTNDEATDLDPVWSPDGTQIAFTRRGAEGSDIYVMNADGRGLTNLTPGSSILPLIAFAMTPDWSPDGSLIAFRVYVLLYVMSAGGGNGRELGEGHDPSWSPDGSAIAFENTYEDPSASDCFLPCQEIYVMNLDGTDVDRLTNNDASDSQPSWQPLPAGDANCRDGVNAVDALLVLQVAAGRIDSLVCEGRADVNSDGRVDSVDAALILQYDAGLVESLA